MGNKRMSFWRKGEEKGGADKTLFVKLDRCPQNHPCPAVRVCPVDALTQK